MTSFALAIQFHVYSLWDKALLAYSFLVVCFFNVKVLVGGFSQEKTIWVVIVKLETSRLFPALSPGRS